jgi:peroxiredoxin
MPSVQRVHDAAQDGDLFMLAISIDGGGLAAVKRFLDKKGYTLPALLDGDMEIARAFGARGVPSTFVIDRQGMVVAQGGSLDVDSKGVKAYIEGLMQASKS